MRTTGEIVDYATLAKTFILTCGTWLEPKARVIMHTRQNKNLARGTYTLFHLPKTDMSR